MTEQQKRDAKVRECGAVIEGGRVVCDCLRGKPEIRADISVCHPKMVALMVEKPTARDPSEYLPFAAPEPQPERDPSDYLPFDSLGANYFADDGTARCGLCDQRANDHGQCPDCDNARGDDE